MTEYWVSTKKHYCKICKIWCAGHIRNIEAHNRSKFHMENEKKQMKASARGDALNKKQDDETKKMLEHMEAAAQESVYGKSCTIGSTTPASVVQKESHV